MLRARKFYRSPLTPVSFALTGGFVSWGLSPIGPSPWRDTRSLQLLRQVIPFPVMAAAFAVYVLLMVTMRLKAIIVADFIGSVAYLSECIALILTTSTDQPTNPLLLSGAFLSVVLHLLAMRLAIFQKILA